MDRRDLFTAHGIERMKERTGLCERKATRMVELAKERGKRVEDCKWSADRKLLLKATGEGAEAIAYNGFCYIISRYDGRLITTYRLPRDFDAKKTRYNSRREKETW